jgi:hypothetical protein
LIEAAAAAVTAAFPGSIADAADTSCSAPESGATGSSLANSTAGNTALGGVVKA